MQEERDRVTGGAARTHQNVSAMVLRTTCPTTGGTLQLLLIELRLPLCVYAAFTPGTRLCANEQSLTVSAH